MPLQPLPSGFPFLLGKFCFLFHQCSNLIGSSAYSSVRALVSIVNSFWVPVLTCICTRGGVKSCKKDDVVNSVVDPAPDSGSGRIGIFFADPDCDR
jgi:hypothetical protein